MTDTIDTQTGVSIYWAMKVQASAIPAHMHEGVLNWILYGRRSHPGGFLRAVLENNLKEAWARADATNRSALQAYVHFFYHDGPYGCWGSKQTVKRWKGLLP